MLEFTRLSLPCTFSPHPSLHGTGYWSEWSYNTAIHIVNWCITKPSPCKMNCTLNTCILHWHSMHVHNILMLWPQYRFIGCATHFWICMQLPITNLQMIDRCLNSSTTVVTPARPKATLLGVLVHILPQDHLPALLICALHPCLRALAKVILVDTVLPFPAASFIWTGYIECVQLSSDSFVQKELHNWPFMEEWAQVTSLLFMIWYYRWESLSKLTLIYYRGFPDS